MSTNVYDINKHSTLLTGLSAKYFYIPRNVIIKKDEKSDTRRVSVYSFFAIKRNFTDDVDFFLNDVVKWTGYKPNPDAGMMNDKIYDIMGFIKKLGWVSYEEPTKLRNSHRFSGRYNFDRISKYVNDINNRKLSVSQGQRGGYYALIWVDELYKIMQCESKIPTNILLLVFAYCRLCILRRREYDLVPAEVYSEHIVNMANDIGILPRTFSASLKNLCNLDLLSAKRLPAIEYEDGKKRTSYTLICNYEKRGGSRLYDMGMKYVNAEMKMKTEELTKVLKSRMDNRVEDDIAGDTYENSKLVISDKYNSTSVPDKYVYYAEEDDNYSSDDNSNGNDNNYNYDWLEEVESYINS